MFASNDDQSSRPGVSCGLTPVEQAEQSAEENKESIESSSTSSIDSLDKKVQSGSKTGTHDAKLFDSARAVHSDSQASPGKVVEPQVL